MNFIKNIFIKIANRFGLELQRKNIYTDDYSNLGVNLTATIANRVATLTMIDSGASVDGNNSRAKYLDEFLQDYIADRMSIAAEVSLGTGDCLIKPYTDGARIGLDIIKNDNFIVCDSIGNFIKSCLIKADEIKDDNGNLYERIEAQILKEGLTDTGQTVPVLVIYQMAFKNGNEIPLTAVKAWENIQFETIIPNVNSMLFGRYKCPTVNRENVNGVNGVKITYGLDSVMQKAQAAFERFNQEFEMKEAFIFADKTLFTINPTTKKKELPKGKEKLFINVNSTDSGELIKEYSPQIRSSEMNESIEVNFKMLELLSGLSNGILTSPTTNFATATEMKASLQATFAFMTKFRKSLENGTIDLLNAVNVLLNVNNITPDGDWDVQFDWSSSYIENIQEQFNRLMQAESIGAVDKSEVRSWVMDEDLLTAEEKVAEIAEKTVNEVI